MREGEGGGYTSWWQRGKKERITGGRGRGQHKQVAKEDKGPVDR
jgi:hypothetical protein